MPIIAPISRPALLALSNGMVFRGLAVGASGSSVGELTFHTNMTGYQEILTTPASRGQIVVLTYPMIGNVGVNCQDNESDHIHAAGLVIRQLPTKSSNWRKEQELTTSLEEAGIIAIAGVDTRELTRIIREHGALSACIVAAQQAGDVIDEAEAIDRARTFGGLAHRNLVEEVTTKVPYEWTEGHWSLEKNAFTHPDEIKGHLCVVDLGVKRALLRAFADRGYRLTVLPATSSAADILARSPDGVIFSDGPGDPRACETVIQVAAEIMASGKPVLGVGIGHQVLALADSARVKQLKAGHHGVNHPIYHMNGGYMSMSQQNQRYVVDRSGLPAHVTVELVSLFDDSIQGLRWQGRPILSTQGYPDAVSAPRGTVHLFDEFAALMH